ncbi:MAG: nucleoside phosphorylase [Dehalococcoidia bacterium]
MADPPAPSVPQFYLEGEPHLPPERMVEAFCKIFGVQRDQLGIKPVVVASFFNHLTSYLATQAKAERSPYRISGRIDNELYILNDTVSLTTLRMGAPAAVMDCEELIACGAKTLIIVGAAGSLQPDLPIGSVTLPTAAIREEGTSHHYLPPELPATATPELVAALHEACMQAGLETRTGLHWTTDAPYREHKTKIDAYREAGVLSVDMEVSALYVLAQHRGVACASVLAISDELYEPWRIGFTDAGFLNAVTKIGAAAMETAQVVGADSA